MASIVTNNGLQRIGVQASQANGTGVTYNVSRHIQTMAVDDGTGAFASGHDDLSDPASGDPTQLYDAAFDSTPARTNQTIAHVMTIPTGSGNFTIRRVSLHDNTPANVDLTSATLVCGIDGQSLTKTSDFTLKITVNLTYTSV